MAHDQTLDLLFDFSQNFCNLLSNISDRTMVRYVASNSRDSKYCDELAQYFASSLQPLAKQQVSLSVEIQLFRPCLKE
jgi:hypothetical protein